MSWLSKIEIIAGNQKRFWVNIDVPCDDESHNGTRNVTIKAKDLAGNELYEMDSGISTIEVADKIS